MGPQCGGGFTVLCVVRLSQITTVPGSISGTKTSRIYTANASPFIAPLMTQGAIN